MTGARLIDVEKYVDYMDYSPERNERSGRYMLNELRRSMSPVEQIAYLVSDYAVAGFLAGNGINYHEIH